MGGVRPCSQDETDATSVILPSAAHQASRGVVEDGADINLDVPPFVKGLVQQGHNILPFHSLAVESLGPPDQAGLCQTLLPGVKMLIKKVERKISLLAGVRREPFKNENETLDPCNCEVTFYCFLRS